MAVIVLILAFCPALLFAQDKNWERDWRETLLAAKKEGKVVVAGNPDPVMRNEIIPRFMARFGLPLEFVAGSSTQIASRIRMERSAGVYTLDVFMPGVTTAVDILYPEKMIGPLRPQLILPEVVDPSKWKPGKLWFIDPEESYVLRVFSSVSSLLHINAGHVRPEEIRASKDLLNPKWRGQIATLDPTVEGRGASVAARLYQQAGEEFVKRLYIEQSPATSRERRQLADWLGRGTYPICLACREDDVRIFQKEGIKISEIFELSDVRAEIGSAPWLLSVMNQAPHPNAARVFVNWIVSREGLELYSRGHANATLRNDVDESFLSAETIPRLGINYFDVADWEWALSGRKKTRERIRELLKK